MKLVFVCTGNTCRSPMAAEIAKAKLRQKGLGHWEVASCGIFAHDGEAMSPLAQKALEEKGLSGDAHRAMRILPDHLEMADFVITMTRDQKKALEAAFPMHKDKIRTLAEEDIPDPYGGDEALYRRCMAAIDTALERTIDALADETRRGGGIHLRKIALGSDHGGKNLKDAIKAHLMEKGYEVIDYGTDSSDSCDYPDLALPVALAAAQKEVDFGILCCGTGIGVSIAANKVKGVRAALVGNVFAAHAAREHNDANVLCLGERVLGVGLALEIVDTFLGASFEGGRHARRVEKLMQMEDTVSNG